MNANGEPIDNGEAGFSPEALAEQVYERVAEDERLRGDLTDDGYGPLLDWCANRIMSVAQTLPDPSLDYLSDAFRETMAALVAAAETGDAADLEALAPEVVDASCVHELSEVIAGAEDPDERAALLAARLQERSP